MQENKAPLYVRTAAALERAGMDASLIREEWFEPQPQLMILGGGHISCELTRMGSLLDFHITVMDDRAEFANKKRFAQADEVICDEFENLERHLVPQGYYVVVTRGHEKDYECVRTLLRRPCRYLGMIGSRAKAKAVFERLEKDGFSEAEIASVHAPIGLDIGAQTPAEIAVSILAQIIAVKNKTHAASASRELLEMKEPGVLCVITQKRGSGPRGVGSMMFVTQERTVGSIGGGSAEYAATLEARRTHAVHEMTYDLSNRDSAQLGMICGGTCRVLFIPVE